MAIYLVDSVIQLSNNPARACFSKGTEAFWPLKAIFNESVFKERELNTPETYCMKGTPVHVKDMCIEQLCNPKV